jgi:hypothetical protein
VVAAAAVAADAAVVVADAAAAVAIFVVANSHIQLFTEGAGRKIPASSFFCGIADAPVSVTPRKKTSSSGPGCRCKQKRLLWLNFHYQLSGLASELDWKSLVNQLIGVRRTPKTTMAAEQTSNSTRRAAPLTRHPRVSA